METKETREQFIDRRIRELTEITNVLNNAVVSLSYIIKVKGDELDDVSPEEYVEFVQKHIHPLTRRSGMIVSELARKTKESLDESEKKTAKKTAKKATKKTTKK